MMNCCEEVKSVFDAFQTEMNVDGTAVYLMRKSKGAHVGRFGTVESDA